MKQIAIFASGAGSNAAEIINYFRSHETIRVGLVVSNKPEAGVLDIARKEQISSLIIEKETFFRGSAYLEELKEKGVDFIVLAGFLWKVPSALVKAYPGRIINIHPALLPKYGGKGMYGRFVHEAVVEAKETETGITIHYVDELYDHGQVIFQERVPVTPEDTPGTVAQKVHRLEHQHFPKIIEAVVAANAPANAHPVNAYPTEVHPSEAHPSDAQSRDAAGSSGPH
jgi:phosphoribosylglycinamide formyltransferase-1